MSSDEENQSDEVSALESIYSDEELSILKDGNLYKGQFFARTNVSSDFKVYYKNLSDTESSQDFMSISYLPPVRLNFQLPSDYPSKSPPNYTISCQWLSVYSLALICRHLDELWKKNEGMVILFNWFTFLKDESLDYLSIYDKLDVSGLHTRWLRSPLMGTQNPQNKKTGFSKKGDRDVLSETAGLDVPVNRCRQAACSKNIIVSAYNDKIDRNNVEDIVGLLRVFNDDQTRLVFQRTYFPCDICCENALGRICTQFQPCGHVFCNQCVRGYFEARIEGNQVASMPCLADGCDSEASQRQVKETVGNTLFERYDSLLLGASLDAMSDVARCPRRDCGIPVVIEQEERMAVCPLCRAAFCSLCQRAFHGVNPCSLDSSQRRALAAEYAAADPEASAALEARYGRRQLEALLNAVRSDEWIENNTKPCPDCKASIQKAEGCNKVVCGKCNLNFCWLCSERLNPVSPYLHFTDPSSKCAGALFQGIEGAVVDILGFGLDENEIDDDDDDDINYIYMDDLGGIGWH